VQRVRSVIRDRRHVTVELVENGVAHGAIGTCQGGTTSTVVLREVRSFSHGSKEGSGADCGCQGPGRRVVADGQEIHLRRGARYPCRTWKLAHPDETTRRYVSCPSRDCVTCSGPEVGLLRRWLLGLWRVRAAHMRRPRRRPRR